MSNPETLGPFPPSALSPASSIDANSDTEFDKLIEHQTRKSELIKKRDALARKRLQLKEETNRLNAILSKHKQHKLQQETKKKLEFFLHQNDHESIKLSAPDQAANFVLDNLDILPSFDYNLRRGLSGKFYPNMRVDDIKTCSEFLNGARIHLLSFTVAGDGLPNMKIEMKVCDEIVIDLAVKNYDQISSNLQRISQSYQKGLLLDYIAGRKLDLIMSSYNSLAYIQNERVSVFYAIARRYKMYVTHPPSALRWQDDPLTCFLCLPFIQLTVESNERQYNVKLHWSLILAKPSIGKIDSKVRITVLNEQHEPLEGANELFLRLLSEYGPEKAFHLILNNLFNI